LLSSPTRSIVKCGIGSTDFSRLARNQERGVNPMPRVGPMAKARERGKLRRKHGSIPYRLIDPAQERRTLHQHDIRLK
jgi:hypothetical protein